MRSEVFFLLVASEWGLYLLSLLISGCVFFFLGRRYVRSLIDPLFFAFLGSFFANAVPLFLYFTDAIKPVYFYLFLLFESAFWVGFCLNKRADDCGMVVDEDDNCTHLSRLFLVSAFFVVAFQLLYYVKQGIPIFFESRLEKYSGADAGLGLFERLSMIMKTFCILYSFANIKSEIPSVRLFSRAFLVFVLITFVLSGSRSALLGLVLPYFFYMYYIQEKGISLKQALMVGGGIFIIGMLVLVITSEPDSIPPYLAMLMRLSQYGDIYYEGYANEVLESVHVNYPLRDLFVGLFAPFRLMSYTDCIDIVPSIQIHNVVYPELESLLLGPNNRIPVLYYTFWGTAVGAIAALITGFMVSFIIFRTFRFFNNNILNISIYASLYMSCCGFVTDPVYAMGNLASFIIAFIFIALVYSLILYIYRFDVYEL